MPIGTNFAEFLTSFHSNKFSSLRPSQEHVLKEYSLKFSSVHDVAIELPTGAGKTLIALLISEAWRRDHKKVAVLSANKTLARQMLAEAKALGAPSVLMEGRGEEIPSRDKRDYSRANNIAIMNYWVYYNQKPVVDPADLLIMDDAHLAEHCLDSLWSVEINRHDHQCLFKSIVLELSERFPEYTVLQDALCEFPPLSTPPELLSFIDQEVVSQRLNEIIQNSPLLSTDLDLKFRWDRMRGSLKEANIYMGVNSIWIRPYVYPLQSLEQYSKSSQRLYMSATIGDPSDLSRRLGAARIVKLPVPPEYQEATSGRRLIVINRIEDIDIPERLEAVIYISLNKHPKSVWMCNSKAEAETMREVVKQWLESNKMPGHPTWILSSLGNEIDEFKAAEKGHLFVGGRFDGMDFHGDECRLVVLNTLPRAINLQEEFISAYLRDSAFMIARLNQRIVQALGRCNRSENDYAVYILADRRFASHFGRETNRQGIPKNMIAELDIAEDMTEREIPDIQESVTRFLEENFNGFDYEVSQAISRIPVARPSSESLDIADDEITAWTAMFASQNFPVAAQKFEQCWKKALNANLIELGAYYGWCLAKARYLEAKLTNRSVVDALQIFEDAINRGGRSSWFNRMRASLSRARQTTVDQQNYNSSVYENAIIRTFDDQLEHLGKRGDKFERWCQRVEKMLRSNNHAEFQEGLEFLGKLLGYTASRPRNNSSTDCLWKGIFGNTREVFTFEAKIEHSPTTEIVASDVGQAHNQLLRAKKEYERLGYSVRGIIVTYLTNIARDAQSALGEIRILQKDSILLLWEKIKLLFSRYRDGWSLDDVNARLQVAASIIPLLPRCGWFTQTLNTENHHIPKNAIVSSWRA